MRSPFTAPTGPLTVASLPHAKILSGINCEGVIHGRVIPSLLRALIVDDEPVARRVLREELELQPDIEVVGEADGGQQALAEIEALQPDLVFLDLQMPEIGGLEVIRQLRGGVHLPVIIVVTAFDQYAIRAFNEGAVDYLLKPVAQARLEQSLDRARLLVSSRAKVAESVARLQEIAGQPAQRSLRKIVGRSGEEYFLLNASEVLAFQADGEIVWVITAKQRYTATQSLRKIQEKLVGTSFRRIRRNVLVNVEHVRKMAPLSSNRWLITLKNDQEFIVSKRLAKNVREILSW